uniref:striatin-like n=1 Tax=Epinephelus lanceolatus TaxID=310571 RepID=UPI00144857F2|nr:striatin-like [Epinephelus lanceolatus]
MDEQAGPGVFFNNNNNSVLPGGGKGPLPDGDAGEAARAQYSIPGILHFLQHEWARFEVERAQWEVERAELQTLNGRQLKLCLTLLFGRNANPGACRNVVQPAC